MYPQRTFGTSKSCKNQQVKQGVLLEVKQGVLREVIFQILMKWFKYGVWIVRIPNI